MCHLNCLLALFFVAFVANINCAALCKTDELSPCLKYSFNVWLKFFESLMNSRLRCSIERLS
ncbi:hypothetical protein DERP_014276 [Dermatophagoides pteronyssinus]|uniref:Uncharacterized protein n=1 Tax=Dermatophagoides pteronyssinus TaxID=6956 RepID=A0ABQ8IXC9_DERPT|nr:hypothetical protein DERP_014276 [Dermatophagoides pteronyssinus]